MDVVRFQVLNAALLRARYTKGWTVKETDAEALAFRVADCDNGRIGRRARAEARDIDGKG